MSRRILLTAVLAGSTLLGGCAMFKASQRPPSDVMVERTPERVKRGEYLFDGIGTDGNLHITFGPGYSEHISGGRFDPSWEGTEVLEKQIGEQVKAAGDVKVVYFVNEPEAASALRALIASEGQTDNVSAYFYE